MNSEQDNSEQPSEQPTETDTERLPWRWNRIKLASGNDAIGAAARADLAAEAEHSHRRRVKGA